MKTYGQDINLQEWSKMFDKMVGEIDKEKVTKLDDFLTSIVNNDKSEINEFMSGIINRFNADDTEDYTEPEDETEDMVSYADVAISCYSTLSDDYIMLNPDFIVLDENSDFDDFYSVKFVEKNGTKIIDLIEYLDCEFALSDGTNESNFNYQTDDASEIISKMGEESMDMQQVINFLLGSFFPIEVEVLAENNGSFLVKIDNEVIKLSIDEVDTKDLFLQNVFTGEYTTILKPNLKKIMDEIIIFVGD